MAATESLPVLMYHYISNHANSIAVAPELFELHCRTLTAHGWQGVSLAEAESYFLHGEPLPEQSCLITLDDGYLDNYVHAWPILEKYGQKGVIFAVAERVAASTTPRPTLRDVWEKRLARTELPCVDMPLVPHADGYVARKDMFFSWEEARRMEQSGVISVASHSLTHTSVFTGSGYSGFLLPGDRKRTFDATLDRYWGLPLFPQKPALAHQAFIPSEQLAAAIKNLVPQDEHEAYVFAADTTNIEKLHKLAREMADSLGDFEDGDAMLVRMRHELAEGKRCLEQGLGHAVHSLCWPWGAYCGLSLELGKELGFTCFYTTREGANPPGDGTAIRRFKAKAKGAPWLRSRLWVYSRPWLGNVYARCRCI